MKNKKLLFGLFPLLLIVLSCASRKSNNSDWAPVVNYWKALSSDTIVTPSKKSTTSDLVPILLPIPSTANLSVNGTDSIFVGAFYISETEITNGQYAFFLNNCKTLPEDLSTYVGTDCRIKKVDHLYTIDETLRKHPVVGISYEGTIIYTEWLTEFYNRGLEEVGLPPSPSYRLPSYTEFQVASLNKFTTEKIDYTEPSPLGDYAWFQKNSASSTHEVEKKKANEQRIHDMKGNVSEWVADVDIRTNENIYFMNPLNLSPDSASVCGGSYADDSDATKYLANTIVHKNTQTAHLGFRVCMTYLTRSSSYEF